VLCCRPSRRALRRAGELAPILTSLVRKDGAANRMLDNTSLANKKMGEARPQKGRTQSTMANTS
jgi:hypothetical protein